MSTKPFSGSDETVGKQRWFNLPVDQTILRVSPTVQRANGGEVNEIFFMCTRRITALVTSFVLAAAEFFPGPAFAQHDSAKPAVAVQELAAKPIGKVVVATGAATLERANAVIIQVSADSQAGQAKVGDLVYEGDVVATGADGRVGINFTDGSSFNLSNNARMVLNEFVYDPNSTANGYLFNLTKVTFTFVAGKVAKTGDMKVDTPVATMGIRGTTPRVEISDDGTVRFSTLVEEGKSKVARKPQAVPQPELRDLPRSNLNICRGC